ncbi:MAG: MaoC family dehydratase [Gammaproteobacteria bacterium]
MTLDEAEIVEFAERYDPQPFHIDRAAAAESFFGGIIASGWHTSAVVMRLLVDHFISRVAGMGSPGVDELRWLKPVRPGDTLGVRVTILETRASRSKPDRGIVRSQVEVLNQDRDVVMTLRSMGMVRRKPA